MNIRNSLTTGIGGLILLIMLITAASLISVNRILEWEKNIYEVHLVSIDKLIEADRDAYQSHLNLVYYLWDRPDQEEYIGTDGELLGEVTSNLEQVQERYEVFRALQEGRAEEMEGEIAAFDRRYSALSDKTESLIAKRSSVRTGDLREYEDAFQALRNGLDIQTEYTLAQAEKEYALSLRTGRIIRIFTIAMTVVSLGVSLLLLIMLLRKTLRPINAVSATMKELSEADGDLTKRFSSAGNDEITLLSDNMNSFLSKTENILIGLRETIEQANGVKDGLVASVEENSSAATEISANVESISRQIQNQDGNLQVIRKNQESMENSMGLLNEQVENQTGLVENSTASITGMLNSISHLARVAGERREATQSLGEKVSEGSRNVGESNKAVQAIYADVDSIIEMTRLISGIASQTNLLSMNAAIEAAHAGEAGRGFAVVADEIRKLAETSSQQSSSINAVLSRVIGNIEQASGSSEYTSKIFSELTEEFEVLTGSFNEISQNAQDLDRGGRDIMERIGELSEKSRIVESETGTIKSANATITGDLNEITDGSLSISQATGEISQGMREVSTSLEDMRSLSVSLSETMEAAAEKLKLFKLSR